MAILTLAACIQKSTVEVGGSTGDSDLLEIQTFQKPLPGEEVRDEKRGKEVWFAIGAVSGVPGVAANGVADAHYFDSNIFLITTKLNIEMAEPETYYEAWLKKEDGALVSLGQLVSAQGDVRHSLTKEFTEDLRSASEIVITLEKADASTPGTIVAMGTLIARER